MMMNLFWKLKLKVRNMILNVTKINFPYYITVSASEWTVLKYFVDIVVINKDVDFDLLFNISFL